MDLKRMRERAHARHLARRGDVMLGAQEFWDGILHLSRELIPEDDREISRDLFALIAYSWAVASEKGRAYDPFEVLRTIRDRAWLGHADTPALVAQVRRDLPRAGVAGRMASYFGELAAKRGTYLFLPIVSRIDRHQLGPCPGGFTSTAPWPTTAIPGRPPRCARCSCWRRAWRANATCSSTPCSPPTGTAASTRCSAPGPG